VPARIKKGDTVMIVSGKDKGKTGTVLEVRPGEDRVVVEGLNVAKRHRRPRPPDVPGGVIDFPAPIHLSNVMPVDPKDGRPTRVRTAVVDGRRVRVAARSGQELD
jgi:large subunit ribosomal protein L24